MAQSQQPPRVVDYGALHAAVINRDPYAHVVVRHFVPGSALGEIVAALPQISAGGSFPVMSVALGPAAQELVRELEGPTLRKAIAGKFGLDLKNAPTMLTIRGMSRERDGQIHRDSDAKRVTALLYLNPASAAWAGQGGSLRLLRSATDMDSAAVEVPPVDGTLLVFPNGPNTWHGHRPYVGRRYVMQLNYMQTGFAAQWELFRHRMSATFKRSSRAA
jgi:hypothetical protein